MTAAEKPAPALALPDRPSITVLPLDNISGDKDQEYFSDGISEDIITELSRFSDLFVIARNSSFQHKLWEGRPCGAATPGEASPQRRALDLMP